MDKICIYIMMCAMALSLVGAGGLILCDPSIALIGSMEKACLSTFLLFLVFALRGNDRRAILSVFRPVARDRIRQRLPIRMKEGADK